MFSGGFSAPACLRLLGPEMVYNRPGKQEANHTSPAATAETQIDRKLQFLRAVWGERTCVLHPAIWRQQWEQGKRKMRLWPVTSREVREDTDQR